MDPLRVTLFLGLVLHKLLWEILKRRDGLPKVQLKSSEALGKWMIKSVKVLALTFLGIQTLFLNVLPIVEQSFALRMWGTFFYFIGLSTAILGRVQLGRNWIDLEDFQVLPKQSLTTTGVYSYIRHPIYTGDILLLTGLQLALNSWLVLAVSVALIIVVRQAAAEEILLTQAFPGYKAYCKRTKRFIPFIA